MATGTDYIAFLNDLNTKIYSITTVGMKDCRKVLGALKKVYPLLVKDAKCEDQETLGKVVVAIDNLEFSIELFLSTLSSSPRLEKEVKPEIEAIAEKLAKLKEGPFSRLEKVKVPVTHVGAVEWVSDTDEKELPLISEDDKYYSDFLNGLRESFSSLEYLKKDFLKSALPSVSDLKNILNRAYTFEQILTTAIQKANSTQTKYKAKKWHNATSNLQTHKDTMSRLLQRTRNLQYTLEEKIEGIKKKRGLVGAPELKDLPKPPKTRIEPPTELPTEIETVKTHHKAFLSVLRFTIKRLEIRLGSATLKNFKDVELDIKKDINDISMGIYTRLEYVTIERERLSTIPKSHRLFIELKKQQADLWGEKERLGGISNAIRSFESQIEEKRDYAVRFDKTWISFFIKEARAILDRVKTYSKEKDRLGLRTIEKVDIPEYLMEATKFLNVIKADKDLSIEQQYEIIRKIEKQMGVLIKLRDRIHEKLSKRS